MKITFKIQSEFIDAEHSMSLNEDLILGRSSKAGFIIDDLKVSSYHCRISFKETYLEVVDMKSKNGTYVNNVRVEQAQLFLRDNVRVGGAMIIIDREKCDPESMPILTFPGIRTNEKKDDFNNNPNAANAKPMHLGKAPVFGIGEAPSRTLEQQEGIRRKRSEEKVTLTPEEIRHTHRSRLFIARIIDLGILLSLLYIPLYIFDTSNDFIDFQHILIADCIILIIVLITNIKLMEFTLGEIITGIRRFYRNQ